MARLDASLENVALRGQAWDHFFLDASAASGGISAVAAIVEDSDTLASSAALAIAAQAAIVEASDTLASSAALAIAAAAAIQEAGDTLASSATGSAAADPAPTSASAPSVGGAYSSRRVPAPRRRRSSIVATSQPDFRVEPPAAPQPRLAALSARAFIVEADDVLVAAAIIRSSPRQIRARRTLQLLAMH